MTASLLVLSGMSGAFVAATPADAADSITVYVRDDGFSQTNIQAREGDRLIFVLDAAATLDHSIAWERGYFEFQFSRPDRASKAYPEEPGKGLQAGPTINFYDSSQLRGPGPHPPGPFSGTLTVTKAPVTTTSSSTTSTTVTTAPPTTVTTAPTTTTSAPTAIKPQLVPNSTSTSTTTATTAPAPPTPAKKGGDPPPTTAKKDNKDKGKGKAAEPETATTTAPPPPSDTTWIDSILGPTSLTPSPTLLPDQPAGDSADEVAIDAAEVASLLEKPASDNDDNKMLLIGLAAVAVLLLAVATSAWFTRSSRYDPA